MKRAFIPGTNFLLITLICALSFTSCSEDKEDKVDPIEENMELLADTGILGRWEIAGRIINNISDLTVPCCEEIELSPDENINDYNGLVIATSSGIDNQGVFALDTEAGELIFDFGNRQIVCTYQVDNDRLSLQYVDDGDQVDETWVRIN